MLCGPLDDSLQHLVSSRYESVLSFPTLQKTIRLDDKRLLRSLGRPRTSILSNLRAWRTRSSESIQLQLSPPPLPFGITHQALRLTLLFIKRLLPFFLVLLFFTFSPPLQPPGNLVFPSIGIQLCPPRRGREESMSSRSDALLEHPLPPLRVWMELGFLLSYHGSRGVHGVWVGDLLPTPAFTQGAAAPAFLIERVLAGRAMYDPG